MSQASSTPARSAVKRGTKAGNRLRAAGMGASAPHDHGQGWADLSSFYRRLAAARSGRHDIQVRVCPGATDGSGAKGYWMWGKALIALDGGLLPASPEQLRPRESREHFDALAALHGVFEHELGHAIHTVHGAEPAKDPRLAETETIVEEIRMEAAVVRRRPAGAKWLRACAAHILLPTVATMPPPAAGTLSAALCAVLYEGRVAAGSLQASDITALSALLDQAIAEPKRSQLAALIAQATGVADGDHAGLRSVSQAICDLFPPTPDEEAATALSQAIAEAMGEAASDAQGEGAGEAWASEAAQEEIEVAAQAASDAKSESDREQVEALNRGADRTRAAQYGEYPHRTPSSDERTQRSKLARQLRKARFRDRAAVRHDRKLPPGRLRATAAMQADAHQRMGRVPDAKPFRSRKRVHVDEPSLRVALLADVSGSMSGAMPGLSSAAWIIANAVHDSGGTCAMLAFGSDARVMLEPGNPPMDVIQFQANGGTDFIGASAEAAEKLLDFTEGPRLVVSITDGCWADPDATAVLARMQSDGIGIVMIGIGASPSDQVANIVANVSRPEDVARVVGSACIAALRDA